MLGPFIKHISVPLGQPVSRQELEVSKVFFFFGLETPRCRNSMQGLQLGWECSHCLRRKAHSDLDLNPGRVMLIAQRVSDFLY